MIHIGIMMRNLSFDTFDVYDTHTMEDDESQRHARDFSEIQFLEYWSSNVSHEIN